MKKTNIYVSKESNAEKEKTKIRSFLSHSAKLFLLVIMTIATQNLQSQCTMVCHDAQVSLGLNCDAEITYAMVADTIPCPMGNFIVEVYDESGNTLIPTSPVVNNSHIGQTLVAKVIDLVSGNSCWSYILIEDKMPPTVQCVDTLIIPCTSFDNLADPIAIDNCDPNPTVIVLGETEVPLPCDPLYVKRVERQYTAVDSYGNQGDTCTQILLLERVDFALITWPDSLLRITGSPVLCDDDYDLNGDGVIDPEFAGVPELAGDPLYPLPLTFCNIGIHFSDFVFPTQQCVKKIMRTWTVTEWWCGIELDTSYLQIIEIVDTVGPVITCPDDFTVAAGIHDCEADVYMPALNIGHNCPSGATVNINYPGGFLPNSNGGQITLPIGTHVITYQVADDCGNITECTVEVTVEDLSPPVAVCESSTIVSLTTDGVGKIFANTFDDGSFDNCGNVWFKVRRMNINECDGINGDDSAANGYQEWFDDYVKFCCEDVGGPIMVQFRVYDRDPGPGPISNSSQSNGFLMGHWNECMVEVEVQDKLPPDIVCPPNITVSCTFPFDPDNLDVFGTVHVNQADVDSINIYDPDMPHVDPFRGFDGYVIDNCGVTVTHTRNIQIDNCGEGRIVRTFRASDPNGTVTCRQIITFTNDSPFDGADIDWPDDYTTNNNNDCDAGNLDPDNLPARFAYPRFTEDQCDLVASSHDDWVFDFGNGTDACFKIIRKWKVIDWCNSYVDPQTGGTMYPSWEHQQVLVVENSIAPTFIAGCDPVNVVSVDPDCNNAGVTLIAEAVDDCTPESQLNYSYRIDAGADGTYDIEGVGSNASGDYPIGSHKILWTVEDQCGNATSCESMFMVENSKLPTPYCYNGLAIVLMPVDTDGDGVFDNGMIDIWANDFDAGSYHSCGLDVTVAFSPNPADTGRIFTCDDVGIVTIEMYVIDENGNYDFCTTFIDVQDNNNVCTTTVGGTTARVAGRVITEDTENIEQVSIGMEGSNLSAIMTGNDGAFAFPAMPVGGAYTINPDKDINYMNGVSTYDLVLIQKHLLGVQALSSPYRMIAADINKSNHISTLDLVDLRRLILGVYDELPNNDSWRFVDASYTFQDPNNPFAEDFPEVYEIDNLSQNMDINFYGVKIGDVNGSVTPSIRGAQNFVVENQQFVRGENIRVDFTMNEIEGLEGYQFTLDFNQSALSLRNIIPGVLNISEEHFGQQAIERGLLTGSWSSALGQDINTDDVLFSLEFNALTSASLAEVLKINSRITAAQAYSSNDQVMNLGIEFKSTDGQTVNNFELFQNTPNPFEDQTTISFNLPESGIATLSIYDATGRLLRVVEADYNKGFHEIVITQSELAAKGLMYYRLDTEKYSATRRMVIMK